jgi:hypothetical protein
LAAVLLLMAGHYLKVVTIGTDVSVFVICLLTIYGAGFYLFAWVVKQEARRQQLRPAVS